jgi:Icc protein
MNGKLLKIGQISDIHIGEDENLVQGIDVRANFRKALCSKSMEDIDILVLSGDLANEDGEPGAYQFVSEQVKDLKVPVLVIPGNHDRLEVMAKYFDLEGRIHGEKCYFKYELGGHTFFFLDSACGTVSVEQLEWLKSEAAKVEGEVFLFMHHPPCFCGHRFMDSKYSLKNKEEVQAAFASIPNLTHIFCGHYHSHFELEMGRQKVHVAPSTQMQIDSYAPNFILKSSAPEWMTIEIGENFVETAVYLH